MQLPNLCTTNSEAQPRPLSGSLFVLVFFTLSRSLIFSAIYAASIPLLLSIYYTRLSPEGCDYQPYILRQPRIKSVHCRFQPLGTNSSTGLSQVEIT
jgi:hypothetical protein